MLKQELLRLFIDIIKSHLQNPKSDLPKRTGHYHYVRVVFTPQQQPEQRLDDAEYQLLTELA